MEQSITENHPSTHEQEQTSESCSSRHEKEQTTESCSSKHEIEQGTDKRTNELNTEHDDVERQANEAPTPTVVRTVRGIKWFLVVIATLISIFLYALDNTVVADIVPAIVNDFNSVSELPWLSVGFALGGIALAMPFGKLYGLFDAKWLYISCVIVFMAASALCGGAPNIDAEIVGRAIAGAGGNGMYLGVLTLLSVNTTDQERPIYLGLVGVFWGMGTVLGPVVGGGIEKYSWRWAFYINLLLGAVFSPVMLFLLPRFDPAKGTPTMDRLKKIDWLGLLLSLGGFICWVMAINFGGVLYAWESGSIIALFVVGGVLWILFFIQQIFKIFTTEATRLFPLHMLWNKEAVLIFMTTASGAAAAFIPVNYIPIYFIFTRGDSGIEAAVRLLPYIFLLSFTILANGAFMGKLGYYKPWFLIGTPLLLVGGVLMSRVDVGTSARTIYGYEVLIGIGAGAYAQSGFAIVQAVVPPEDMSSAITFIIIGQLSGITFGLAIAGAVFVNEALNSLQVILPNTPVDQLHQLIAGTSAELLDALDPTTRARVLDAVVSALDKLYIPVYVAAAIGLICAVFLRNKKMFP